MSEPSLVESFSHNLQQAISSEGLPDKFYDSFEFTKTGKALCHPITLSIIGNAVAKLDGVAHVGIDVRLNFGDGVKFQPDVVGFRLDLTNPRHVIYVDFESPNSSDARIVSKDIAQYLNWAAHHEAAPYIVITALPDNSVEGWKVRSTTNPIHRQNLLEIRMNPLRY